MSEKLRTDFTKAERNAIIWSLRDEYGDREFSEELILLECQDVWRKGCHSLENGIDCRGCMSNGGCSLIDWPKHHPEYKDDTLAKRLKELRDEVAGIQHAEITKRLLEKGYVKVQRMQWIDGKLLKSDVKLYLPGSKDLKADIADAIENWKGMWGEYFMLPYIKLNATRGKIMDLRTEYGDEYEIWKII